MGGIAPAKRRGGEKPSPNYVFAVLGENCTRQFRPPATGTCGLHHTHHLLQRNTVLNLFEHHSNFPHGIHPILPVSLSFEAQAWTTSILSHSLNAMKNNAARVPKESPPEMDPSKIMQVLLAEI